MKKLFPFLLSYALLATQCYAISGGPGTVGGGGRSVNVIGAYSGTIIGVSETDATTGPAIPGEPSDTSTSNTVASNALGLFDLTVPGVSTATGAFVLFASGRVFSGTISASVDPDKATLQGVLDGAFNFTVTTFDATGAAVTTQVGGYRCGLDQRQDHRDRYQQFYYRASHGLSRLGGEFRWSRCQHLGSHHCSDDYFQRQRFPAD